MGVRSIVLGTIVLIAFAPFAGAVDPFHDQVCLTVELCYGAGTCVTDVGCVPRGCEPLASCSGEIGPDGSACAVNATIDGRTCASHIGLGADTGQGSRLGARVQLSNGSVEANKLDNTWIAPGVEGELGVAGFDFGGYHVYLYRSDILTEGPRGGPYGQLAPSENHTWTEIGVVAGHHGGPFFGEDIVVAVELLDLMPESCWIRAPSGALPEFACPSLAPLYP